jgi:hypothetical protein
MLSRRTSPVNDNREDQQLDYLNIDDLVDQGLSERLARWLPWGQDYVHRDDLADRLGLAQLEGLCDDDR